MYLTRKVYVKNWEHMRPEEKTHITIRGAMKDQIDRTKITHIEEEAMYWRKANAIHQWFVDNVQKGVDDCGDYYVSRKQLQELYDKVSFVLSNREAKVASDELPPQNGFFFGSTDIDEWYWEDMENTEKGLKEILSREDDLGDYYYQSSW